MISKPNYIESTVVQESAEQTLVISCKQTDNCAIISNLYTPPIGWYSSFLYCNTCGTTEVPYPSCSSQTNETMIYHHVEARLKMVSKNNLPSIKQVNADLQFNEQIRYRKVHMEQFSFPNIFCSFEKTEINKNTVHKLLKGIF